MAIGLSRNWLFASFISVAAGVASLTTPAQAADDTSSLQGKPAPAFTLKTLNGETASLEKMKGSVVLIDVWATWCPPCRKGLPHINEIAENEEYKKQGLVVWAVDLGEPTAKPKDYVAKEKLNAMTVVLDTKSELGKKYMIQGIPTTMVIDRQGNVAAVWVGLPGDTSVINKAVEEALKKDAPKKAAKSK